MSEQQMSCFTCTAFNVRSTRRRRGAGPRYTLAPAKGTERTILRALDHQTSKSSDLHAQPLTCVLQGAHR
jgi:hypothetical protein